MWKKLKAWENVTKIKSNRKLWGGGGGGIEKCEENKINKAVSKKLKEIHFNKKPVSDFCGKQ